MNFIRNILALIGLCALLAGVFAYYKYGNMLAQIRSMAAEQAALEQLDPKA